MVAAPIWRLERLQVLAQLGPVQSGSPGRLSVGISRSVAANTYRVTNGHEQANNLLSDDKAEECQQVAFAETKIVPSAELNSWRLCPKSAQCVDPADNQAGSDSSALGSSCRNSGDIFLQA